MADQATHMMPYQEEIDGRGLRAGVSELLHDVFTLAELQWQLTVDDGSRWTRTSIYAGVLAVGGAVCALAALTVAMIGVSYLLVEAGLPLVWALLLTGGAGMLIGLGCLYGGVRWLGHSLSVFDRSRSELRENLAWLKHALKNGSQSPADKPRPGATST